MPLQLLTIQNKAMKVKINIEPKVYVQLILYIANLNTDNFININIIDKINIREMYIDALVKHSKWRYENDYNVQQKNKKINLDINLFGTLNKILCQFNAEQKENYEVNLLRIIYNQCLPQIKNNLLLTQTFIEL